MLDLKKLKLDAESLGVLYVEDNDALRDNASKLLKKFFTTVYVASNGREGLQVFRQYNPQIVITDIKMPYMSGVELIQIIKSISPDTKTIIMSAFDDKEYLYQSIELGVFRFLKKPVNITELTDTLYAIVKEIRHENNTKVFYTHLKSIFNYQSSMVAMIDESTPVLANQIFLDFFEVENIEDFVKKYGDIGKIFLKHSGFLYNKEGKNWFDEVSSNENKLFHVKIASTNHEIKHYICKYQKIPEKKSSGILSFDDITELHLLKLFDEKQTVNDENLKDTRSMFQLLEVLQRNSAKLALHNYYKGLSITNNALIMDIKDNSLVLKTNFLQQKAIQYEKKTLIISEALPKPVICDVVTNISFENQTIELKEMHFIGNSPVERATVRIVPEENHKVTLFVNENKFQGEVSIADISLDAVNLTLNALPPSLKKDDKVIIDMVLSIDKRPLIINTKAVMFRKSETRYNFNVVFFFNFNPGQKSDLVKYITQRQMNIIREFKGLQNG